MSANVASDQRFLIRDLDWDGYRKVCASRPSMHKTYRAGTLELTTPSLRHERRRRNLGGMIELYAKLRDITIYSYGSRTFTNEAARCGVDPDECYAFGSPIEDVPDIALEVVEADAAVDKLAVYAGLGVPELWLFEDDDISVYFLDLATGNYRQRERSWFLPDLDIGLIGRLALRPETPEVLDEFADIVAAT